MPDTTTNPKQKRRTVASASSSVRFVVLPALILMLMTSQFVVAQEQSAAEPNAERTTTWQPPAADVAVNVLNEWQQAASQGEFVWDLVELKKRIAQHPNRLQGLLQDSLVSLFPVTAQTAAILSQPPTSTDTWKNLVAPANLSDKRLPRSASQFLKHSCACWLARHGRYDDALELFAELRVSNSLDPAAHLFYSGLCHHRLLQHEEASSLLNQLLQSAETIPNRFATIGKMMLADIESLEPDSLREVSRLMQDIQRRQSLHRSGKRVLAQERQVISKLDQMITKLEEELDKQQQQQQQSQSTPSQGAQPMEQESPAGGKGDGEVAKVPFSDGGDWGNLPPKQRAAVLAEITRDMPPHYREVIEEYFRQLAKQRTPKN